MTDGAHEFPDRTCPTELWVLGRAAVSLARTWVERAATFPDPPVSRLLARTLADPDGLSTTLRFVDGVLRPEDPKVAAATLREIASQDNRFLPTALRAAVSASRPAAVVTPSLTTTIARRVFRELVGDLVVDAAPRALGPALARLRANGDRLNVNLLGEAVLGDGEAARRREATAQLAERDDVDYVSLKASAITGPHAPWGFDHAVEKATEALIPLYRRAQATGTFVNLDMEDYKDVDLTIEVFTRTLSRPEFADLEAGIVLQAYLPDSLAAMQHLQEWAAARVAAGGAPIRVRVVKGANLSLERVDAELHGWTPAPWPTKQDSDTHYKRVLAWALTPERTANVRIGVAGQNVFDLAFAHLLARARGVSEQVQIEMLAGMAPGLAKAIREDTGPLLLYVPVVDPAEFDVAIAYLVRRLEENAHPDNFMSSLHRLAGEPSAFAREEGRFLASLAAVDDEVPAPRRRPAHQPTDPEKVAAFFATDGAAADAQPTQSAEEEDPAEEGGELPRRFANAPDSDPSLAGARAWMAGIAERAATSKLGVETIREHRITTVGAARELVAEAREAGERWATRSAAERAAILHRAGEALEARRADLIEVAMSEANKTADQADPEVSEAIDFAHYYATLTRRLEDLDGATFLPARLTLVASPWNFPIAIPTGGVMAALAAGSAVILKPAPPARRCGAVIAEILWDAGIPRDVLRFAPMTDGRPSQRLVESEDVDRVVLTGSFATAEMFRSWRPDLQLMAETSGKNALIVTPSADRDLAVKDAVYSAFGHAGQKCSAASLLILVGSAAHSRRLRDQLVDAVVSLRPGPAHDLATQVSPLLTPDEGSALAGLTELGEGEHWVVRPRDLGGGLWTPGVRAGVKRGSKAHMEEFFAPVLSVMTAADLDEAIEIANQVPYGLTAGLHSLDEDEQAYYLGRIQAGNVYINRGTTGAIVRRQPFGGWKRSSVGVGSKAGGPSYLLGFGNTVRQDASERLAPTLDAVTEAARPLVRAALPALAEADAQFLLRATASDGAMWDARYSRALDPSDLVAERNILRQVPTPVLIRVGEDGTLADLVRVTAAGLTAGSHLDLSTGIPLPDGVRAALRATGVTARDESDEDWLTSAAAWASSGAAGLRVRLVGGDAGALAERINGSPDVAIHADPPTESGRVELLPFLKEQAISITAHRYGTPIDLPAVDEL